MGGRVVVRHRLPAEAGAGATDVLGILRTRDEERLVVDSAAGPVTIARRDVVAAKDVPPPPSRPGPAHERIGIAELELVMAQGWVAVEQAALGRWLLRSAPGFTGRANSVLAVGDPRLPLDQAVDFVERWYRDRGQAPMFQIGGPAGFDPASDEVAAHLLGRGYTVGAGHPPGRRVRVLTAPAAALSPPTGQSPPVLADDRLEPGWLTAYEQSRPVVPGVTERVLTGSRRQLFLSVRHETSGRVIAIARLAVHPGWVGVFGLWVHPEHRRRGIATALVSAAGSGPGSGVSSLYAQVSEGNSGATALWERLGFTRHHDYTYLSATGT